MPANLKEDFQKIRGFSLIEIMVGMTIGLLGAIVIMQVFSVSEARKRTTVSGDDAQNTAAIALYSLQREIQLAGYGTGAYAIVGCNVALRSGWTLNAMAPVTINHSSIPAGDSNTDTLLVVYGNANQASDGDGITTAAANATSYVVQSPLSFSANDIVLGAPSARSTPCNLSEDVVASSTTTNISVTSGVAYSLSGGTLFNLGQAPVVHAYAIRSGNLTMCDYRADDCSLAANASDSSVWVPIASNIVSMRAAYGHDTNSSPMDGIVDAYDRTTPTTQCGWVKTPAIRFALVARSAERVGATVTTSAPSWAGDSLASITLSANSDWQKYRYKTLQTIVPIKNVAWQGVNSAC